MTTQELIDLLDELADELRPEVLTFHALLRGRVRAAQRALWEKENAK